MIFVSFKFVICYYIMFVFIYCSILSIKYDTYELNTLLQAVAANTLRYFCFSRTHTCPLCFFCLLELLATFFNIVLAFYACIILQISIVMTFNVCISSQLERMLLMCLCMCVSASGLALVFSTCSFYL